ncbi:MAG: four helix bundle protein [Acidimicrobiia bacterium]
MRDFRRLKVWGQAHQLTLDCYVATRPFPQGERFGLVSQIRRSASSVAANIAEGCGRDTSKEFRRFLSIAAGSVTELRNHLLLSRDLGLMGPDTFRELDGQAASVRKMLAGLMANPDGRR